LGVDFERIANHCAESLASYLLAITASMLVACKIVASFNARFLTMECLLHLYWACVKVGAGTKVSEQEQRFNGKSVALNSHKGCLVLTV
jgi:hypothetical protein